MNTQDSQIQLYADKAASFPSTEIFYFDLSETLIQELAKTASPAMISKIRSQPNILNTDTRRVYIAIESRINWFFKSCRGDLRFDQPDSKLIIDLENMTTYPATSKQQMTYAGSWLFSWKSEDILISSGFSPLRKDVNTQLVEKCLEGLFSYEFLMLTGDEIESSIGGLSRILTGLQTRQMDHRITSNFFTVYPAALKKITEGTSGIIFKTKLLSQLTDKALMLLQIILRYLSKGSTPALTYHRFYMLLYTGKKKIDDIAWSHFKRDDIKRHLPMIESTFEIKLTLEEGTTKEGNKGYAWIKIDTQNSPYIKFENRLMLQDNNAVINLDRKDYFEVDNVRPRKTNLTMPRVKRVYAFDKVKLDKKLYASLRELCGNSSSLKEESWDDFYATTLEKFDVHYEAKEYTQKKWNLIFKEYLLNGWRMNSEKYLKVSFKDFLNTEEVRKGVERLIYESPPLSYSGFCNLEAKIKDVIIMEAMMILSEAENHYVGKYNSAKSWEEKVYKWLSNHESFTSSIELSLSKQR